MRNCNSACLCLDQVQYLLQTTCHPVTTRQNINCITVLEITGLQLMLFFKNYTMHAGWLYTTHAEILTYTSFMHPKSVKLLPSEKM